MQLAFLWRAQKSDTIEAAKWTTRRSITSPYALRVASCPR